MTHRAREQDAIRAVVDRLINAFRATRSPAEIETAVAEAHQAFTDRPVRDFIPVLVERRARSVLGHQPPTANGPTGS
ncbi:three-helix bundle dimerization domain-containing protein [Streptomyces sediminimaris]|uniref:three-helix bundle dimerization domain-containing protein n=1 Tax=Streptomyces sediminimaris TaxID=3383721 RepID=UPI00399BEE93